MQMNDKEIGSRLQDVNSFSNVYNMSGRVVSEYTNSSRRREFVYPIQHGRECCKQLKKRLIL